MQLLCMDTQHTSVFFLCAESECPAGVDEVACFAAPCLFASCPAFPFARCVDDYCGGCNARFYTEDGEVTEDCEGGQLEHNTVLSADTIELIFLLCFFPLLITVILPTITIQCTVEPLYLIMFKEDTLLVGYVLYIQWDPSIRSPLN